MGFNSAFKGLRTADVGSQGDSILRVIPSV